jgi:hypothetical protein
MVLVGRLTGAAVATVMMMWNQSMLSFEAFWNLKWKMVTSSSGDIDFCAVGIVPSQRSPIASIE